MTASPDTTADTGPEERKQEGGEESDGSGEEKSSDQKPVEEDSGSDRRRYGYRGRGQGGGRRGGRGGPDEGAPVRMRLPRVRDGEIFGIAETLLGGSRIKVMCEDGKSRMARIPGKMKKREWIREGDLVIIKPWEFQDDKADVVWRYTKTQSATLARRRLIPDSIDIFS